jgi:SNF2 family DNA or RNA helicase
MLDVSSAFADAIQGQPLSNEPPPSPSRMSPEKFLARIDKWTPDPALLAELKRVAWPRKPLDHQYQGIAEQLVHRAWLTAWDMGTAKTSTSAYAIAYRMALGGFRGPILIACPLSVCRVWRDELKAFGGLDSVVCVGDKKERTAALNSLPLAGILITNYETLKTEFEALVKRQFDCIYCDESHRIKNSSTQTFKALRTIARASRYRYCLSGTPVPNGPLDLFGQFTFMDASILGTMSKKAFEHRHAIYAKDEVRPGVRLIVGYRDLDKLAAKISNHCSRVLKTDVCKSLPPKTYQNIPVTLSPKVRKIYKQLRDDSVSLLESRRGEGQLTLANVLSESLRLLQVAGGFVPDDDGTLHPLTPNAKLDLLEDLVEDVPPQPTIIWAAFREEVKAIADRLGADRCAVYMGGMSNKDKQQSIDDFRGIKKQFFVCSYAAREGLTLIESCLSVFYSRSYNLLDWLQSQDRIYRIGQQMPVTIMSLVAEDTIDEKIGKALANKAELQHLLLKCASLEEVL